MWINDDELVESGISKYLRKNGFVHFECANFNTAMTEGGRMTGLTTSEDGKLFAHFDVTGENVKGFSIIDDDVVNQINHLDIDQEQTGYSITETITVKDISVENICHFNMDGNLTGVTRIVLPLKVGGMLLHYTIKE